MGPRAGLDRCGISRPTGNRSPDRPARSLSLYRLSYPGPHISLNCYIISIVLLMKATRFDTVRIVPGAVFVWRCCRVCRPVGYMFSVQKKPKM